MGKVGLRHDRVRLSPSYFYKSKVRHHGLPGVIERLKPTLNGYCRLWDGHHNCECGTGLLLTVLAMTHCDKGRLGSGDISKHDHGV
jgi:hypothetical protein